MYLEGKEERKKEGKKERKKTERRKRREVEGKEFFFKIFLKISPR